MVRAWAWASCAMGAAALPGSRSAGGAPPLVVVVVAAREPGQRVQARERGADARAAGVAARVVPRVAEQLRRVQLGPVVHEQPPQRRRPAPAAPAPAGAPQQRGVDGGASAEHPEFVPQPARERTPARTLRLPTAWRPAARPSKCVPSQVSVPLSLSTPAGE
eukprot:TRINITY_DN454_c0_g1_i14.p3 TRINITY_DN454_c0_g1~~TRINITY_DN454_c0_g1_i14.p3  ORF type:complete len:162 (-),score=26.02 TRINITY_DN454_c0_g1_i14:2-487(-)